MSMMITIGTFKDLQTTWRGQSLL